MKQKATTASPANADLLAYQAPQPGVSRGAFRMLLLLTAINTVLLGWFVLGPQLHGFVREQWAQYQERKVERQKLAAERSARLAMLPAQEAAMNYQAPVNTVIYADGGSEEERRQAQAAAATQPSGIVWPGTVPPPEAFTQLPATVNGWATTEAGSLRLVDPNKQVVFLHERRAPGSDEPLLIVVLVENMTQSMRRGPFVDADREFFALTLRPATPDRDLECVEWSHYVWNPAPPSLNKPDLEKAAAAVVLTLEAGQPDPNDAGRFTIGYSIDGVGGQIIGHVGHDNVVRLQPTDPMAAKWTLER